MNLGLQNLIALQDVEQKIASLQKQISEVPQKSQSFQAELESLTKAHQQQTSHFQELAKRRRASEGDVDLKRSKLSRLKDQLMAVKTNKEYTAMLHEIQMAESQIRAEEDEILEMMEEMENLETALKGAEKELKARTDALLENIRACEASVPGMEAEVAKLQAEKEKIEQVIEPDLRALYRRIAEVRKGIALAEAKDELCTQCHVRIRPQVYADLLHSDNIHTCDSCSRILYMR